MLTREEQPSDRWSDGDAGAHLEELFVGDVVARPSRELEGQWTEIELIGLHLRMSGAINTGHFRRLSDYLNHHEGLIALQNATVLRRNGDPTKVTAPSIWVTPDEVTLVALRQPETQPADRSMVMARVPKTIIVVTPGHTLTGEIYISPEAQLSLVIESTTPRFLALTDVRARSLADRRVITRYDFALLNRRHIVAVTELQPGMIPGRRVL